MRKWKLIALVFALQFFSYTLGYEIAKRKYKAAPWRADSESFQVDDHTLITDHYEYYSKLDSNVTRSTWWFRHDPSNVVVTQYSKVLTNDWIQTIMWFEPINEGKDK